MRLWSLTAFIRTDGTENWCRQFKKINKMGVILKGENRYTLRKYEDGEWHLFRAKSTNGNCSLLEKISVCGEMKTNKHFTQDYRFRTDNEMRKICYLLGREVCSVCVGHLYETLTLEERMVMNNDLLIQKN